MAGISLNSAVRFDIGQLPSIPRVLLRLIEACHRADVSFEELSEIIQQDVGLSARIIAIANSPAYAQWNGVRDFNRLLVVLGLDTIKTIAITTAVHQFFSQFSQEGGRWMGAFWRRSLFCACSARVLARLTSYEPAEEAYLIGLLHQVGQLVFLKQEPEGYLRLYESAGGDEAQLSRREREMYGGSAAELGAELAGAWGLGPFLADAIRYQGEPAEAILDTPRLVRLINFCHKLGLQGAPTESLQQEADLLFGLSGSVIDDLLTEVREEVARAAEGLGIDLEQGDDAFYADSEEVRLELARRVREFALLDGVRQNIAGGDDLVRMLGATLQDAELLFGLSNSIFFLLDDDQTTLRAAVASRQPRESVGELRIAMKSGRSLVADALLEGHTCSSFDSGGDAPQAVVDSQLVRLLEGDGLICIPLIGNRGRVGILVAAVDSHRWRRLREQKPLLDGFAEAAADLIQQRLQADRARDEAVGQERERQQRRIRELIHEANNPLAIVTNYLQVLALRLKQDPALQKQLSTLQEEVERVGNIILRLRDVPGAEELPRDEVDVNRVIGDLLEVFRLSHFEPRGIRLDLSLDDGIPVIHSNRNSLKQILTNLIRNAVEALPEGGTIGIATRDQVNRDGRQYVEIRIEDDGPGLPAEVLANLFQPVTSSKGKGHAGLGLTIVRNLVSELGGSIGCRNRRRGGVEFVILLPRKTAHS
ncbi:MAG TPA: HDOD domain-containing protein [Sedimenticola thiotaurini]|uniref:histidine kinase n=1 Tax=Sedimenticola thiotaurini TaxID=1543721 RepID=A0A831RJH9_9GAMM|nr:HDOD domain-containing protein [Sedimenticola thiotaurini]